MALKFGVCENIWILDQRCVVGILYEDSLQPNYKAPAGEIILFCLTWNYAETLPVKTDTIRKCNHLGPTLPSVFRRSQNLGSSRNTFQIDHLHNLEAPIIKDKMTGFSVNGTYDTNTWKHQIFIQKQRLRVIAVSPNYPAKGGTEWLSDASWPFTKI